MKARDGEVGHVEDLLLDDDEWWPSRSHVGGCGLDARSRHRDRRELRPKGRTAVVECGRWNHRTEGVVGAELERRAGDIATSDVLDHSANLDLSAVATFGIRASASRARAVLALAQN